MAQSKSSKKLMNMVYGLGASVVILGALFKIMHWPFGNEMLILGLVVESIVFAVSAQQRSVSLGGILSQLSACPISHLAARFC